MKPSTLLFLTSLQMGCFLAVVCAQTASKNTGEDGFGKRIIEIRDSLPEHRRLEFEKTVLTIASEMAEKIKTNRKKESGRLTGKTNILKGDRLLKGFVVTRSRFYKSDNSFGWPEPIIEMTVKNNLNKVVSRVFFMGTLASPGRSIPWLRDDFNYEISGGLEPGEEATWRLSPNMFGPWADVKAPNNAVLTLEVTRLYGADGELLSAEMFEPVDSTGL